jgi:hypothetical protein
MNNSREERASRIEAIWANTTGDAFNLMNDHIASKLLAKISTSISFGHHLNTDDVIEGFEKGIESAVEEMESRKAS